MSKKLITLKRYIDNNISAGDKVQLIDGSGLCSHQTDQEMYIVYSYPHLTHSNKKLKELTFNVLLTGVKDIINIDPISAYQPDLLIEYNGFHLFTCSQFVKRVY